MKDPETGVEYLLSTLRPYFVKDGQSVFLYKGSFRCSEAWLDITTPRPDVAAAAVVAEVDRLRERLRAEARHTCVGAPGGLQAHGPEANNAMREAVIETVWKTDRQARVHLLPISNNFAALMALVMADLSESQRETLMNFIFQRGVDLTALTVDQLREFLVTLFQVPKSSLENPSWAHKSGPRSILPCHMAMEGTGFRMSSQAMKSSSMTVMTFSGCATKSSASG